MADADLREIRPRQGGGTQYQPRQLFPEADRIRREEQLFAYVSERLVELATAKALYITDLLNQPLRIREVAGMICLGLGWNYEDSPKTMRVDPYNVTPSELVDYRVKVKSLNGQGISWKKGMAGQGKRKAWQWDGTGSAAQGKVDIAEDVYLTSDKTELSLPVHYAWNLLRQHGKNCVRHAKTKEDQQRLWTVEEIKPEGYDAAVEPADQQRRARRTLPQ